MILFRLREPGDEDWTEVQVEGELEDSVELMVEHALCTARYVVERRGEDGWESVNE